MHKTLFDTPILKHLLHWVGSFLLFCSGWKAVGTEPEAKKYVLIAAPHTSNWDLYYMLLIALKMKVKIYWMGKSSIFSFPWFHLMRWLGGIPIDRTKSNSTVDTMVQIFNQSENLTVTIPPEGTRSKTVYWKSGFYHIANGAQVPICLGFLDYSKKEGGLGPLFYPTGELDKDMERIEAFYSGITGKYPDRFERTSARSES